MEVMTVTDVANLLGKSERWVREFCRSSKPPEQRIPHAKLGGSSIFIKEDVVSWIKAKAEASSR